MTERKSRKGIPMTEEEVREWQQAFIDIEESIEKMDLYEEQRYPYIRLLRAKQQDLF